MPPSFTFNLRSAARASSPPRPPAPTQVRDIPTLQDLWERDELSPPVRPYEPSPFAYDPELNARVSIWRGDITTLAADVIVNAANRSLLGGGGVDGAIHRAAGPLLLEECKGLGGAETGESKITRAYDLPARYIAHTVGPIFSRERAQLCRHQLEQCYYQSLMRCLEFGSTTIGFSSISTGIYGYPMSQATNTALEVTRHVLENHRSIQRVIFVVFSERDYAAYEELAPYWFPGPGTDEDEPTTGAQVKDDDADAGTAGAAHGKTEAAELESAQDGDETGGPAPPSNDLTPGARPVVREREGSDTGDAADTVAGNITSANETVGVVRKRGSSSEPEAAPPAVKAPPRRDGGDSPKVDEPSTPSVLAGSMPLVVPTTGRVPGAIPEGETSTPGNESDSSPSGSEVTPPLYERRLGTSLEAIDNKGLQPAAGLVSDVSSSIDVAMPDGKPSQFPGPTISPRQDDDDGIVDVGSDVQGEEQVVEALCDPPATPAPPRAVSSGRNLGPTSSQLVEDIVDDWDVVEHKDAGKDELGGGEGGAGKAGNAGKAAGDMAEDCVDADDGRVGTQTLAPVPSQGFDADKETQAEAREEEGEARSAEEREGGGVVGPSGKDGKDEKDGEGGHDNSKGNNEAK